MGIPGICFIKVTVNAMEALCKTHTYIQRGEGWKASKIDSVFEKKKKPTKIIRAILSNSFLT